MYNSILLSNELKALYSAALDADSEIVASIVLQSFAGFRAGELDRLNDCDIDFDGRQILISSRSAKCRIIDNIPNSAWLWLEYCKSCNLLIVPKNRAKRYRRLFQLADIELSPNKLRISFAEHFWALTSDADRVRKVLGLRSSHPDRFPFLTPASRKEAEAYFSVTPSLVIGR